VPLADSAPLLDRLFDDFVTGVGAATNADLIARFGDARRASDTEVELAFVKTYRTRSLRRFGDRLLTVFEGCIERNDCKGWPRFDRIALKRSESVYGEARYN